MGDDIFHRLRTSITTIRGTAQLIARRAERGHLTDADAVRSSQRIIEETQLLEQHVDDLQQQQQRDTPPPDHSVHDG